MNSSIRRVCVLFYDYGCRLRQTSSRELCEDHNRKLEPILPVALGVAVGFRRSRSVFAAIFFGTSIC